MSFAYLPHMEACLRWDTWQCDTAYCSLIKGDVFRILDPLYYVSRMSFFFGVLLGPRHWDHHIDT